MARILLTWELGGGLGHLANLAPIALELVGRGHTLSIASRNLRNLPRMFRDVPIAVYQSPMAVAGNTLTYTFAYILKNCGVGEIDELRVLCEAWNRIYDAAYPDLILFDHSPVAMVASFGREVKRSLIGTGFFYPPDETPMRALRKTDKGARATIRDDEARLLSNVNSMFREYGIEGLTRLSELYQRLDANFAVTFAELDHYPDRRQSSYLGAWWDFPGTDCKWPNAQGPKIFCYLKDFPGSVGIIHALQLMDCSTCLYVPNPSRELRAAIDSSKTNLSDVPLRIRDVAREADLAILNGNHGTTVGMLLNGVPTLQIPNFMEQIIFSRRVCEFGAGLTVAPNDPVRIALSLQSILNDNSYRERAEEFQKRYIDFDQTQIPAAVANVIEILTETHPAEV